MQFPHIQSHAASVMLLDDLKRIVKSQGKEPEWRLWLRVRKRYLKRMKKENKGNLICYFCDEPYLDMNFNNPFRKRKRKRATVDHMLAQAKGGRKYDVNNFCVACRECNEKKADTDLTEFVGRN
ncbi:HNH endonuclease [bacterium]|nr:HNH endonuclease [bacterium]